MERENPEEQMVQHIPSMRRYARALLGDRERADDLVQDTLARGLDKMRLWAPGTDMRAWLFSIMHNLFVNAYKKSSRQPACYPLSELDEASARDSRPDQLLQLSDLEAGLKQLLPEQKEVLLLITIEGMSYQEVSEILNIPRGTVMSRLHRAREHLRRWMSGEVQGHVFLRRVK